LLKSLPMTSALIYRLTSLLPKKVILNTMEKIRKIKKLILHKHLRHHLTCIKRLLNVLLIRNLLRPMQLLRHTQAFNFQKPYHTSRCRVMLHKNSNMFPLKLLISHNLYQKIISQWLPSWRCKAQRQEEMEKLF
jgi:hypothetical protein